VEPSPGIAETTKPTDGDNQVIQVNTTPKLSVSGIRNSYLSKRREEEKEMEITIKKKDTTVSVKRYALFGVDVAPFWEYYTELDGGWPNGIENLETKQYHQVLSSSNSILKNKFS